MHWRKGNKYQQYLIGSVLNSRWLLLTCLLVISTAGVTGKEAPSQQCTIIEKSRFDCWPDADPSEDKCLQRGCCWMDPSASYTSPDCFFPSNYSGYSVTNIKESTSGIEATLTRSTKTFFSPDVMTLKLSVEYQTDYRLRIKLYDPNNARYEVPMEVPSDSAAVANPLYKVTIQEGPFNIQVTRIPTGLAVFNTADTAPLIFSDQYIQIATQLTTRFLYGFGEHRNNFLQDLSWRKLVFWNRDDVPKVDNNGYGSHNYFLNLESATSGNTYAHGVFLLNSNAAEVALQPFGSNSDGAITYRLLGGILDFLIVMGPTPLQVVSQFNEITGPSYMPPFWSLGYHICKYGIANETELKAMIDRNRAAEMPYDTQWSDIDYMDGYKDWTFDKIRYGNLPSIVKDLHDNQQRYIMIVDPGISSDQPAGTYPPFDEGKALDIFVKNASGDISIGRVWPGVTAFPDFFHPNAFDYWYKQASRFHDEIPFDGLWLDMNEPSNFVTGSTVGCTNSSLDNPPYTPPYIDGGQLIASTLCPSAQHHISTHYNLHNMYGWSETNVTRRVLDAIFTNKRSPIITRSTFAGSTRHTGHWLGDNDSNFSDLFYSIPGILNFNLFGLPFVGVDICGFRDTTTPELCTRWHQLAIFYPFMRNHADHNSPYQDPATFDHPYQDYMRFALFVRYRLLAVLYTAFFKATTEGLPIVRPLFFLYPGTESLDKQFMWTDQLLVSPVLEEGAVNVSAYIPNDVFYDFFNGSQLTQVGQFVLLDAPLGSINIHTRGGSILPLLPPTQRTDVARQERFQLVVAPDAEGNATGDLFWDDGVSADSISAKKYSHIIFNAQYSARSLRSSAVQAGYKAPDELILGEILLYNILQTPNAVIVNGRNSAFFYSQDAKVVSVVDLIVDLLQPMILTWT